MKSSPKLFAQRVAGMILMIIGGIIWFLTMAFGRDLGILIGIVSGIAGTASALGGRGLYNRARQLAHAAEGVMPAAGQAVVYLRSFDQDSATGQAISSGMAYGASGVITEEEQLVESLSQAGQVIAVGKPNEQLPPLGATRLHFRQDEWQQGVAKLLLEGRLVVIRPGSFSPGVRWELQQTFSQVQPERLVLIVTGRAGKGQDKDLAQFAAYINPMLPHPIPVAYPKKALYRLGTVRAFVCFDRLWSPTLLPVTVSLVPVLRRSITKRLVPYFREALRPVLTRLNCPPPKPPLSAGMVVICGGLGLVFVLAVVQLAALNFR